MRLAALTGAVLPMGPHTNREGFLSNWLLAQPDSKPHLFNASQQFGVAETPLTGVGGGQA